MEELLITLAIGFTIWAITFFFSRVGQMENAKNDVPAHTPIDEEMERVLDTVLQIKVPDVIPKPGPPTPEEPTAPDLGEDAGAGSGEADGAVLRPSFAIAHAPVARIEGGYQRHKADRGNYNREGVLVGTNWGIAAPVAEAYFGRTVTRKDMEKLDKSVAMDIFRRNFWNKIRADEYPDQQLANIVYDGAVNHGVYWGVKLLQRSMGIRQDGIVGPVTLATIRIKDPEQLYNAYFTTRQNFYHAIVANRPSQQVFLRGWLRRLEYYRGYQVDPMA
ncbi:MAG: glycosyl hydrolase 108 family protein [Bacteroidota bacterium]